MSSSRAQALSIGYVELAGFVHDSTGLLAQLGPGSAGFFSSLNASTGGTFGWTYTNSTGNPLTDVSFLGFLDMEIDEPLNTFFNEYGVFVSLALPGGAPAGAIGASSWEIDEPGFVFGDIFSNLLAGSLDNSNAVPQGLEDDVSLALGFTLGALGMGDSVTASFQVALNNVGGLNQVDPDSNAELWFNGYSTIETAPPTPVEPVPEPGTLLLMGSGLAGLGLRAWRQRQRCRRTTVST